MDLRQNCDPQEFLQWASLSGSYDGSETTMVCDTTPPHPDNLYSNSNIPDTVSTTTTRVVPFLQEPRPPIQPIRHEWTEKKNATISRAVDLLVVEAADSGSKRFFCGLVGCRHSAGFVRKVQLLTHIRSVHFCEKPFVCTTCDASFTRRQDAVRHVDTMNSGKQYKCGFCEEGFARKDYRDRHAERCRRKS
ncbi:hypothetical protein JB92DRAFT_289725 [Gautieria morchelliformis]|nr:hypothetical protein JB92DRAFT_289725 [Gautieria morchelliformis]